MGRPARAADEKLKDNNKYDQEHWQVMEDLKADKAAAETREEKDEIQLIIDSERNKYSATLQRRNKEKEVAEF